jgi:hypothetical protein
VAEARGALRDGCHRGHRRRKAAPSSSPAALPSSAAASQSPPSMPSAVDPSSASTSAPSATPIPAVSSSPPAAETTSPVRRPVNPPVVVASMRPSPQERQDASALAAPSARSPDDLFRTQH